MVESLGSEMPMSCIEAARHPLLHRIAQGADWTLEDEFPSCREWADEHELWLRFVDGKGELNRFCPRLKKSAFQRDRTLSEIGIAYFLETHCSLPIIEWEPEGEAGRKGEFLVNTPHGTIFVEVKTGGWQKDISTYKPKPALLLLGLSFAMRLVMPIRSFLLRCQPFSSSETT